MKKTFIALSCIGSLLLAGCASKDIPQPESEISAPQISEEGLQEQNLLSDDEEISTADESDNTEQEEQAPEDQASQPEDTSDTSENEAEKIAVEQDAVDSQEDKALGEETYILDEIEEPTVITLEPEPEPEPEITIEDTGVEAEPIEIEEPETLEEQPPAEVQEDETSANQEDVTIEDENQADEIQTQSPDEVEDVEDVVQTLTDEPVSIEDEDSETEAAAEEIIPSRKVTLKKQEYLDITYPGSGWVYMGLTDGSKDLSYFGRKLGTTDTKFTLQARNAGTKIIHFYKNDPLTNTYLDDYIEVEILAEKGSNKTHIAAPDYKQPEPKKAVKKVEKAAIVTETEVKEEKSTETAAGSTKPETNASNKETVETKTSSAEDTVSMELTKVSPPPAPAFEATPVDTDVLLQEAQVLYNEKEYKKALEKLDSFFENATAKRDQGLYLKGKILEANSELQDIKAALDSYNTLIKNYPASKYWDDANKRITYLKRFYLEVR